MRKQTQKEKIEALEADAENLRKIALEALRERDDAIKALPKPVGNADDYQRERLALHAFPDQVPSAISWDDLACYFGQAKEDAASLLAYARSIAQQNDLEYLPRHTLRDLVEAFGESLTAARERTDMLERVGEAFGLDGDAADILDGLEEMGAKGTPDSIREDAITLLKDLGYDVDPASGRIWRGRSRP